MDKKHIQNRFNAPPRNDASKVAVLLVNFGGPHNLSSVKDFLYNLFCDPMVLNFPFISPSSNSSVINFFSSLLFRKPLAWFISNMRDMKSREMYKIAGSMSPLIPITYLQKDKLQELFNKNQLPVDVFIGFRYCKPFIEDVLHQLIDYKEVIVLPLYPQYSYTTTGSIEFILNSKNHLAKIHLVKSWHTDEDYIESIVRLAKNSLENLDLRSTEILFSAHSIPIINIEKGDPYENQINETCNLVIEKLGWKKKWHLGYQSKLGPVKWLAPSTDKVIEEIAGRNKNTNILVVPISFTCEHVETIFEIGKLYKNIANKSGIKQFRRVPALNTDKYLIQALYNQVVNCLKESKLDIKEIFAIK